ncbi:MAG: alpha/beta hydrolase [Opitutaceae bacterium]
MKSIFSALVFLSLALVSCPSACFAAPEPPRIELWPEGVPGLRADAAPDQVADGRISGVHFPSLTVYAAPGQTANGTAVVLCPGGGYQRLAVDHEGVQIAQWFNARGVTVFLLRYRLVEYGQPAPLRDVLRAIRIVRSRADEFHVKPDRIGVMGFSAGGHVASSAATLFDAPEGRTGAALDAVSARPDFAILVYPVISMKPGVTHAGSRQALLGENPAPELEQRWSTDQQVTAATPPTFLVHCATDGAVPLQNALLFFEALRAAGVSAELHVFAQGPHGFGMRPGVGPADEWPPLCEAWLRVNGWLGGNPVR